MGNKRKNDWTIIDNSLIKNLKFRKINKIHYEEISKIYNHYIIASTIIYETEPLSIQKLIKKLQLNKKNTIGYTIFYNKDICGFFILRPFYGEETNLKVYQITIYLKNEFTNKGIGTYTIKYIESIAKKKGIISLIASISSENHTSINFFEKNGYIKCGYFRKMGYKFNRYIDNVYYQKLLI